jgi:hypothetical protein
MKSLTVDQIMELKPCYSRAEVEAVFNGRESLTLAEILAADIPPEDRIWVLTQPGVMTPEQVKTFCDKTADRAVRNHCLNCGIKAVEEWAARWLSGEDRAEEAAWAAREAARAAQTALEASFSAARAAYWAAKAAWASREAARAAYWAAWAAWEAAKAAEREAQVADLLEIIA